MNNKFKGIFKEELNSFIEYKKINGYLYEAQKHHLAEFDKYTIRENMKEKILTKELIFNYINSHKNIKSRTKNNYASILRQFAIFLNTYNIEAYILPDKCYNSRYNFHPHIYSEDEIKRIFKALNTCFLKKVPKKQEQVRLILLLLFKTGMRIGEILLIKRNNINYEENTILLENTKNGSDRLIVLNETLTKELYDFEIKYNNKYEYYFENNNKQLYSVGCFNSIFRKLLYEAKIMHSNQGPRVHDIRHTFCVNSLKQAINDNLDINAFIPLLSAYIGHLDLDSTYKYLHLTYELFPNIRSKTENIINIERKIDYEEF
jgi:integrase/recombinase XerD